MDFIFETWHWSVSGILIGFIMLSLVYFGKSFGMSSNLRTLCTMGGAKQFSSFFDFDWREQKWNLAMVLGAILGGFFAVYFLKGEANVTLNVATIEQLKMLGIDEPNGKLVPDALFSIEAMLSFKGFLILIVGGMLIGFGTPYAGGCTSGHAISGLSNLQWPSLLAVIGFFIGGLITTYFIIPLMF